MECPTNRGINQELWSYTLEDKRKKCSRTRSLLLRKEAPKYSNQIKLFRDRNYLLRRRKLWFQRFSFFWVGRRSMAVITLSWESLEETILTPFSPSVVAFIETVALFLLLCHWDLADEENTNEADDHGGYQCGSSLEVEMVQGLVHA